MYMSALAQDGEDIDEEDGDGDECDTEIKDAGGDGDTEIEEGGDMVGGHY